MRDLRATALSAKLIRRALQHASYIYEGLSVKRRSLRVALLTVSLLATSNLARSADYTIPAGYFFLGGLNTFQDFSDTASGIVPDDSLGVDIRAGWRLSDFLAAELEFNHISGFDFDVEIMDMAPATAELTINGGNVTGNIKAIFPVGRIHPYALIGIGGMWAAVETRNNVRTVCYEDFFGWWCEGKRARLKDGGSFVAKFGGGADFWLSEDFALTVDAVYVLPTGELKDLSYVKLGWGAKFKF